MKDNSKIKPITNEEFSVEFGDINSMKLFEIPYMHPKEQKKVNHKKKNKGY